MKLSDLPKSYQLQAEAQLADRTSVCSAKQKRTGDEALGKAKEVPKLHPPVYIFITVYKVGDNWDLDNREIKSLIDSIVKEGILSDDTIKEIPRISRQGIRVDTRAEERTIVEVVEY